MWSPIRRSCSCKPPLDSVPVAPISRAIARPPITPAKVTILQSFLSRHLLVVAALVMTPLQAIASDRPLIAPDVSSFTLENGLQVVVIPDHRAPVVTHMIWYKAGSVEDPPGQSGIAHFLEHLMFKGTSNHPPGEFVERLNEIGGNGNAFTSYDYTAYFQTVSRDHLGFVMEYEADRMANLIIDDDAIATEREVIIEERRSRIDNEPGAQLSGAMSAALYQNSDYGIPIIGWRHEMERLDRAAAQDFYDRYYTPNNAVLVVAGDVSVAEVRRLAEETYGKVSRRADPPPRVRTREPTPLTARSVTLADPRVTLPIFRRSFLVPSYDSAEAGEAEALDMLSEILGGGTTSRLYRSLIVDKAIAASAASGYSGTAMNDTSFTVFAAPRGDVALDTLDQEITAVIDGLIETGVTEDELERAKRRRIAGAIYAQDSQSRLARVFGQALATDGSIAEVHSWPERIEAVTVEEVQAVARKYLDPNRSVAGYLITGPEKERM